MQHTAEASHGTLVRHDHADRPGLGQLVDGQLDPHSRRSGVALAALRSGGTGDGLRTDVRMPGMN
ncbi:MAG: hypothetical protein ACK5BN_06235, partial [Planctomycetota bacterium]